MPTGTAQQFRPNQPPWMLAQIYPDSSICSEQPTKDFLIGKMFIYSSYFLANTLILFYASIYYLKC